MEHLREQWRKLASSSALYWRFHPKDRSFDPGDARSTTFGPAHTSRRGYSCVNDPWYLFTYAVEMGWDDFHGGRSVFTESDIYSFTGTPQQRRGVDGEFIVVPDMATVNKTSWATLAPGMLAGPLPPFWGPKGKARSWREFAEDHCGTGGPWGLALFGMKILDDVWPERAAMVREVQRSILEKAHTAAEVYVTPSDWQFYGRETKLREKYGAGRNFNSPREVKAFFDKVIADLGFDASKVEFVVDGWGGTTEWWADGRFKVQIGGDVMHSWGVLHEIAHMVIKDGGHGPAFAAKLDELLRKYTRVRLPEGALAGVV